MESLLRETQKKVYDNKVEKGFNLTDVPLEFSRLYGEVGEAFEAYEKKMDTFGEELADVLIFLLGISEIAGIDLETELVNKVEKNGRRIYIKNGNGVLEKVYDG
ncbi:hypothetical protein GF362_04320 [Candidatus Dojkabacteria bacterium]|nr:hypothetical protein [Candidatus Dojkabacteria bacterium]